MKLIIPASIEIVQRKEAYRININEGKMFLENICNATRKKKESALLFVRCVAYITYAYYDQILEEVGL